MQASLESERKRAEKFRKRYERLHQKATSTNKGMLSPRSKTKKLLRSFGEKDLKKENNPVSRTLNFHYTLLHSIKERYRHIKSQKERRVICRAYMTGVKLMRKYKLLKWAESQLPLSHRRWQLDPFENGYNRKSKTNPVISLVKDFYCRDDVSRMTTGKKNTITRKKLKMQRRLLTDTLQNLHKKFLSEHTQTVSYSYFCALRPFWVVEPTELDRETCQCKVHENTQFMADKLFSLNVLNTNNLEQLVTEMVCDDDSKACAYGECIACKHKKCNFNPPDDAVVSRPITYNQWKLKKVPRVTTDDENAKNEQDLITVTKKEDVESTIKCLIADFMTSLQKFKRHAYNIRRQYGVYKTVRENLHPDECMLHVDFSENYTCKYSNETQSLHFGGSHEQASLHTGILYVGKDTIPFCTISKCRQHDPPAIWAHLKPILEMTREKNPQVTTLHVFSDGPTTQYKQRGNFYLLCTEPYKMGFNAVVWHFFEASHGKGAPDGIGGALKRTADRLIRLGNDIPDTMALYNLLLQHTSVKLIYIPCSEVTSYTDYVKSLGVLPTVKGTMKLHQIISVNPQKIKYRDISCVCKLYTEGILDCHCYQIAAFEFDVSERIDDVETLDAGNERGPSSQTPQIESTPTQCQQLNRPDQITHDHVGKYCIVLYEENLYPGEIRDIVSDGNEKMIQVKCMNVMGRNKFYWRGGRADVNEYPEEDILCLIPEPPITSKRYTSIDDGLWDTIEAVYGKK